MPPRGTLFQALQDAKFDVSAELSAFCQKSGFDLLLMMTISFTESKEPIRELVVFSHSASCREQVSKYLEQAHNPVLNLSPISCPHPHISAYQQGKDFTWFSRTSCTRWSLLTSDLSSVGPQGVSVVIPSSLIPHQCQRMGRDSQYRTSEPKLLLSGKRFNLRSIPVELKLVLQNQSNRTGPFSVGYTQYSRLRVAAEALDPKNIQDMELKEEWQDDGFPR
ncbi:hypothetical protein GOODEAATRI_011968 [Goodea atripinnis]|uniref:Uncharacterized protein n=1 Tax=Goodea atripinnis TaxID=208336 RepID=A0ABV0PMT7_9TELE